MPDSYSRQQPSDRSLRVGDSDRDGVADILREQHVAGRLNTDELQQRLDRCFAAKTYRELDELVVDLPTTEPVRTAPQRRRWPVAALVPVLIAAIALSQGRLLWLAVPVFLFVVRPLLWRTGARGPAWGLVGCCGPHDGSRSSARRTWL